MITRAPRVESNFYILDKQISEDSRLTWAARGLLIYLLGKKDNWEVSIANLRNQTENTVKPTKRDGIYNLINELISAGYVKRVGSKREGGKFAGIDYVVSEVPCTDLTEAAETDHSEPDTAKPDTALPDTAETTQVSNDIKQELITSKKREEIKEVAIAPTQKPEKQKYSADEIKGVFDYWQAVMRSGRSILTEDRIKIIKKALGLGYSYDDLKSAIHGCSLTPFYMGDNDQGTKHNGIELILRNAGNIEKFMETSMNPPRIKKTWHQLKQEKDDAMKAEENNIHFMEPTEKERASRSGNRVSFDNNFIEGRLA